MEELQIGQKVNNRYQLKEYKGSGSFGEVWLAYDEYLNIDVAIKIYFSTADWKNSRPNIRMPTD